MSDFVLAPRKALKLPTKVLKVAIDQCMSEDEPVGGPLSDRSRERIGLFICAYDAVMKELAKDSP